MVHSSGLLVHSSLFACKFTHLFRKSLAISIFFCYLCTINHRYRSRKHLGTIAHLTLRRVCQNRHALSVCPHLLGQLLLSHSATCIHFNRTDKNSPRNVFSEAIIDLFRYRHHSTFASFLIREEDSSFRMMFTIVTASEMVILPSPFTSPPCPLILISAVAVSES